MRREPIFVVVIGCCDCCCCCLEPVAAATMPTGLVATDNGARKPVWCASTAVATLDSILFALNALKLTDIFYGPCDTVLLPFYSLLLYYCGSRRRRRRVAARLFPF